MPPPTNRMLQRPPSKGAFVAGSEPLCEKTADRPATTSLRIASGHGRGFRGSLPQVYWIARSLACAVIICARATMLGRHCCNGAVEVVSTKLSLAQGFETLISRWVALEQRHVDEAFSANVKFLGCLHIRSL
jgi:hypothetical protein